MLIEKERATSVKFSSSSQCPALLTLVGISNFPISHTAEPCRCTAHPFTGTTPQGSDPPTFLFFDVEDNQKCWQPGHTHQGLLLLRGMLLSVHVPVILDLKCHLLCCTGGVSAMQRVCDHKVPLSLKSVYSLKWLQRLLWRVSYDFSIFLRVENAYLVKLTLTFQTSQKGNCSSQLHVNFSLFQRWATFMVLM